MERERNTRTVTSTTQTHDFDINFTLQCIHIECIANVQGMNQRNGSTNDQDLLLVNRLRFVALLTICFSCICLGFTVCTYPRRLSCSLAVIFARFLLRSRLVSSAVGWKFTVLSSLSAYCPTQIHKESNLLAVSTRTHTHIYNTANPKTAISPNHALYDRNIHFKHFIFIQMKLTISARKSVSAVFSGAAQSTTLDGPKPLVPFTLYIITHIKCKFGTAMATIPKKASRAEREKCTVSLLYTHIHTHKFYVHEYD